jgi:hypothetical protein
MKRILSLTAALLVTLCIVGCTNWERTTFNTLASSDAAINAAQAAYEVSATAPCPPQSTIACLPHSKAVYTAINKAKAAQTLAVNSMVTYEEVKAANTGTTALNAAQADVNAALAQLPTLIANVKALYGGN